jgi:pimeloyl-ACP methyl ester carboxylesterase
MLMLKPRLLLLHGAVGAGSQFDFLLPLLAERYEVHRLDFEGHGVSPLCARPFRTENFAENAAEYLDRNRLESVDIFGYSMGGYVALYLAHARPQRVRRIATLGTKFDWNPEVAAREVRQLDPQKIREKVPQFAYALEARHVAAGWEDVLGRTREMMTALGEHRVVTPEMLSGIPHRVRIGVGDRDSMVTIGESWEAYRALPLGELEVLPATPHPLEKIPPARLARYVTEFFD